MRPTLTLTPRSTCPSMGESSADPSRRCSLALELPLTPPFSLLRNMTGPDPHQHLFPLF